MLAAVLADLEQGKTLSKPDMTYLLERRDPQDTARLFSAARSVRQRYFFKKGENRRAFSHHRTSPVLRDGF